MTDAANAYREMATWTAQLDLAEWDLMRALPVPDVLAQLAEVRELAAVALVAVTQKEAELVATLGRREDAA
jgi:hypothetical protein